MGARFYVNITSEGEIGGPVQEQLLRIAIMRAIENRMSYVRCGNTGISGIIDPRGRVTGILTDERGQAISIPGVYIGEVPVSTGRRTVYSVSRDLFAKLVLLATAFLWIATFIRLRGKRTMGAASLAVLFLMLLLSGCDSGPALGENPGVVQDRIRSGHRAVREGRYAEAIPLFHDACATAAGCAVVLEPIGVCYREVRKIEGGAEFYRLVARTYPEISGPALGLAGRFLEQALFLQESREAYEASLAADHSPEVFRHFGRLLLRTGSTGEALAAFREGLELDPKDSRLRYALARGLRQQGDLQEAREVVERLLEEEFDQPDSWAFLGQILYEQGQNEDARQALRTCLRLEPDNIQGRFFLARFALRDGDLDQFRRHLDRVNQVEETLGRGPRFQE